MTETVTSTSPSLGALPAVAARSGAAVTEVRERVRRTLALADQVLGDVDPGWSPPPYDPVLVAQALGIRSIEVQATLPQGAMLCVRDGQPTVLYRRFRSRERTHFNLFHEIAHTLFPDFDSSPLLHRGRPRLFEPDGRLEHLCDAAALEFMMPSERFEEDLVENGFGGHRVDELCRRFGAWPEAVCLRMVESDLECVLMALIEYVRPLRCQRKTAPAYTIAYSVASPSFRGKHLLLRRELDLDRDSAIHATARQQRPTSREELHGLATGRSHPFRVEALPLPDRRRHGRNPVLAFFYPR